MKAKMLMSLVILAALAILPLGSDAKTQGSMTSPESQPGKILVEKCSSLRQEHPGQAPLGGQLGNPLPDLRPAHEDDQVGAPTPFTARCESCNKQITLEKLQNGAMMLKCPGCGHEMALKCPDCGDKGTMKFARLYGDKTRMECANCHRQVDYEVESLSLSAPLDTRGRPG